MSAPYSYPISERDAAEAEHAYLNWHKLPEAANLLDSLRSAPDDMWSDIISELEGCRDEARTEYANHLPEYSDHELDAADEKAPSIDDAIDMLFGFARAA